MAEHARYLLGKGRLVMPDGPGLGLTVDEKLVRRLSQRG
jgi:L-alanine-DL-glutamate epimerase-like enolase superfamily enzyme